MRRFRCQLLVKGVVMVEMYCTADNRETARAALRLETPEYTVRWNPDVEYRVTEVTHDKSTPMP